MTKPTLLIVKAPYYQHISDFLEQGAIEAIVEAGALFDRTEVPGALEIPLAIKMAAKTKKYDGFVALGCIIRGETSHYDIVCRESASGLTFLALHEGLVIGNGILTCENEAQALERARPERKNKGGDAAKAAISLISLKNTLTAP
jgi:6,7-dimethyl-8-ribityllumazine synthase